MPKSSRKSERICTPADGVEVYSPAGGDQIRLPVSKIDDNSIRRAYGRFVGWLTLPFADPDYIQSARYFVGFVASIKRPQRYGADRGLQIHVVLNPPSRTTMR